MLTHPAVKRPVRTRMLGVVGRAGEKPALTRLDNSLPIDAFFLFIRTPYPHTS